MLVLSRKVGERVLIGENVAVTVVKLTSGGVRLGIDAPPETAVIREELAAKMAEGESVHSSFTARIADKQNEIQEPASTR